jgi:hypothetical protein
MMYGAIGLTCVTCGTVAAYLANRVPKYTAALELIAGIILLCGFALLGWNMPRIERF